MNTVGALGWLIARPIAHRGLHNANVGRGENDIRAVEAAIDAGYNVEVDLQETFDGEALVFHDADLMRLTGHVGRVRALPLHTLLDMHLATGAPLWSLDALLNCVDGRAGLLIEIKSLFRRDEPQTRFVAGIARKLAAYRGPVAVKSFDPDILATMRRAAPQIPRGALADAARAPHQHGGAGVIERFALRHVLHAPRTRPAFVSYALQDLPRAAPLLLRRLGLPLIVWTVRGQGEADRARQWADQIVFEGFTPRW